MKKRLKSLARKRLESRSSVAAFLRFLLFVRQCRRDARLVSRVSEELGIPLLSQRTARIPDDREATLFILAGGATVNELNAEDWRTIERGMSIGINFWPIHPFVPDVLTTETDSKTPANQFLTHLLAEPRIADKSPDLLMLRTLWPPQANVFPELNQVFDKKRYLYGRANVITRRLANLSRDLRPIIRLAIARNLPDSVVPDNGSSVVRLTFYGLSLGFKKIVWVGVDQNSGHYFWTEPPVPEHFRDAAIAVPRVAGQPHSTSSEVNRAFSNDQFLRVLADTLQSSFGVEIYISSNQSSLSDSIPVFPWGEHRRGLEDGECDKTVGEF